MDTLKEILINLNACYQAVAWANDMTIEEAVEKCHRGDWLLWLGYKLEIDIRPLTLAKGHCANTVRHLMKDERSIKAVDAAIDFGNGKISRAELDDAYAAAHSAYSAADSAAYLAIDSTASAYASASASAYAAAAAADSAADAYACAASAANAAANDDAADAATAAGFAAAKAANAVGYVAAVDAADAATAAFDAARIRNQLQTADICRQYIGQMIIDKVNEILTE